MKTTKILVAGLLLMGTMQVNAQAVESTYETGFGLQNGAYQNSLSETTGAAFFGYQAGNHTTTKGLHGNNNTFLGHQSGFSNTTGEANVFVGSSAGYSNLSGSYNIFVGMLSGNAQVSGGANIYVGHGAGSTANNVYGNVFLGHLTGQFATGGNNVFLGAGAGASATGSENVFLGTNAGKNATGNHKLYVANTDTPAPMIYGDFSNNKVGIGGFTPLATSDGFPTTAGSVNVSAYKLFVKGGILTEEVRVALSTAGGWADYVFADDYKLATLPEVEQYINSNGHLPNVPSAKQVKEDGIEVGQMANIHQEKIEELTLYAIQQNKQIEAQKAQLEQQQKEINQLKAAVETLMSKK